MHKLSLDEVRRVIDNVEKWEYEYGRIVSRGGDFEVRVSHYQDDGSEWMFFYVMVTLDGAQVANCKESHRCVRSVPQTTGPVRQLHDRATSLYLAQDVERRKQQAEDEARRQKEAVDRARTLLDR